MALFPPHIYPGPESPPSPLSHRRQRKGRGQGGAGLPLGTAVAQSISPKPRNFLLPKRKKKKKKSQRPPFLPAPLGQTRLDLWGFPGGWLRAGTLSGKSGGVPWQALRQAHFGLLPFPPLFPLPANHQRWPSPAPRSLGCGPGARGQAGALCSPGEGGAAARALASLTLYPCPPFPRAGHFLPQAAVGTFIPLLKSLCHLLVRPPEGPIRPWGWGAAGHMGSSACGAPGLRSPTGMPGPCAPFRESL